MSLYSNPEELKNISDVQLIKRIQFSLPNPEELKNTVEIVKHDLYTTSNDSGKSYPEVGGLYDTRMGVENNKLCPGHFGHIKLAKPVFYMHYLSRYIIKILKCICFKCSKLLLPKNHKVFHSNLESYKLLDLIVNESKNIKECIHNECSCNSIQPSRYYKVVIGNLYAEWKYTNKQSSNVLLTAEHVLNIFKRISDEDIKALGLCPKYSRPEWMICTILPISPPTVRPSIRQDNNQRADDDLTYKLVDIVKTNNKLKQQIEEDKADKIIEQYVSILQYHIATMINNENPFLK